MLLRLSDMRLTQALLKRLLTMTDIQNGQCRRQIDVAGDELVKQLKAMDAPDDAEIVLMKTWHGEDEVIGYYVASMSEQLIFWFEDVDVSHVTDCERAVMSEMHLGKVLHEQLYGLSNMIAPQRKPYEHSSGMLSTT